MKGISRHRYRGGQRLLERRPTAAAMGEATLPQCVLVRVLRWCIYAVSSAVLDHGV
jgi:hypothetical protein